MTTVAPSYDHVFAIALLVQTRNDLYSRFPYASELILTLTRCLRTYSRRAATRSWLWVGCVTTRTRIEQRDLVHPPLRAHMQMEREYERDVQIAPVDVRPEIATSTQAPFFGLCACTPLDYHFGDKGASAAEIRAGTAVVGMYEGRVDMPKGVAGEQMSENCCFLSGVHQKTFIPKRVSEMMDHKSAKPLYDEFQKDISAKCQNFTAWNKKATEKKVTDYQARFNQLGIMVAFHHHAWWVEGGPGGLGAGDAVAHGGGTMGAEVSHQFLTFADMSVVAEDAVIKIPTRTLASDA